MDQPTQSRDLIGSNDDLLTEILLRLPVTSILRFKSVSKHWRFLLSDRSFTHRYDKVSKSPGLFAGDTYVLYDVKNPITPFPFRSLNSYFDGGDVSILQSCNGLLLCSIPEWPEGRGMAVYRYYVFNPTTKQLEFIPCGPEHLKLYRSITYMGLAYHQTDCMHYKVVCIRQAEIFVGLYHILIYSSDTRKWKISIQSFSAHGDCFYQGAVYLNGAVYWPLRPDDGNFLYFKLDVEQLKTLPLPVGLIYFDIKVPYFGESRGHLHLIGYPENSLHLNVYEMLSDHSGWFVKYQLQLDELHCAFPGMVSEYEYDDYFEVIDVVRGEEEEDTFIVLKTPKKFITYNVHDKSLKPMFSLGYYHNTSISSFNRYTETLSSF